MQILVGFRFGFDPINIMGVIDQMTFTTIKHE